MTTPSLVPDIGIMASDDIVAIERASIDAIKMEDLIPAGIPQGMELSGEGHLFQQLHGKNPFVQLDCLEKVGLGTQDYELVTVKIAGSMTLKKSPDTPGSFLYPGTYGGDNPAVCR